MRTDPGPRRAPPVPLVAFGGLLCALWGCQQRASGPEAQLALARAAVAAGDRVAVEAAFGALLREAPRYPGGSLEFGNYLASIDESAQAEPLLRHACALAPEDPAGWIALGGLLARKGVLGEASEVLERAVAAGADTRATWRMLGEVLAQRGDQPERAAECFTAAARHARAARAGKDGTDLIRDLIDCARSRVAAADSEGARAVLLEVLTLEPDQPQALAELERLRAK
ncbi:MAG: hypothetical protein R3F49_20585 [Planctomycetota bacterium]